MTNSEDANAAFASLLEDLVRAEDARKASIETRALAALTVNLSLVTLYIAATAHSEFVAGLISNKAPGWITTSFVAVLVAVVLAFGSALPFAYGTFKIAGLQKMKKQLDDDSLDLPGLNDQLCTIRLKQLEDARRQTRYKVVLLFAAVSGSALAVFCFVAAVLASS